MIKFFYKIPKITRNLISINLLFFIIFNILITMDSDLLGHPIGSGKFNITQPLTSMFLHGNFIHLFFNMLILYIFGKSVEEKIGYRKFLILYILSGIGSFIFFTIFTSNNIPVLGASGAIFGIITSMIILYPNKDISLLFLPFKFKIKWILSIYFISEILKSIIELNDGISHLSHVGGGITGIIISLIITNKLKGFKF